MNDIKKRINDNYPSIGNIDDLSKDEVALILNKIWDNFFNNGNNYLVIKMLGDYEFESLVDYLKRDNYYFTVLNKDNINNFSIGSYGLIVKINWLNADDLYLPNDLNKPIFLKTLFDIKGVYSINQGEGIIDASYQNAKMLSEVLDIELVSFDLHDYICDYKDDYDSIVRNVITYYLFNESDKINYDLMVYLCSKYKSYIIDEYKKAKSRNEFNDVNFLNSINNYIKSNENIKS